MTFQPNPFLRVVLTVSVLAAMAVGLAGCGAPASTPSRTNGETSDEASVTPTSGFGTGANTAQGHFAAAEKAMKAVAPDAVFISVQTGVAVTSPSPMWMYIFASKQKNKGYSVAVTEGTPGKPSELPGESLRKNEWAKVPATTADWKIDSDVALTKATAAYKERMESDPPKRASMGMAVFLAEEEGKPTTSLKPFVWVITYEADEGAATPGVSQILVDAKTGTVLPLPE